MRYKKNRYERERRRWQILNDSETRHQPRKQKIVSKSSVRLSSGAASSITNLEILQLCFELFDGTVSHLQVLVQAIPLGDQLYRYKLACDSARHKTNTNMLLPLPESRLFGLDLLRELLSQ